MANTIAQVTAYLKDTVALNEVFKQKSLTMDIEAPKVQFIGSNVVKLPKITFGAGLGAYSRETGHVANDMTLAWDTLTLTQDKGNKLMLDRMDDEEGLASNLVPYMNEYIRTIVVPAVDTYRFSKLVSGAGTTVALTSTSALIVSQIEAAFQTFQENEVDLDGLVLYLNPTSFNLLNNASTIAKYFTYGVSDGAIDNRIAYFNGAKIVVVPASRLGADTQFILVQPKSVTAIVKHNPASFFAEGSIPGFDGSEIDYRLYHDIFVIANKNKGIYAQVVTE